jgi:DNA-binding protein HU-beta
MSITTKEQIDVIAASAGVTKVVAEKVLTDLVGVFAKALHSGEEVIIKGFGRFSTKERAARVGRNPKTGAALNIPAKTVIKFTPRGQMK